MLHHLNAQPTKPSRVILLGGSGFVGQEITKILTEDQISMVCISSKDIDLTQESSVDKLSLFLQDTDSVVFLSALTPDKGRGFDAFEKNIQMALHM